ncbi:uncharacterized protein [Henckelia pumila]|uniref:uncharacterized protein n=1 Tax=Henckelia pumila TaxID=405737 RepID=UPI003C6DD0D4
MRTWATWTERLGVIHGKESCSKKLSADWSIPILCEFKKASKTLNSPLRMNAMSTKEKWMPPPVSQLRLDTDAAVKEDKNLAAIGGIVRNHEGQPLMAFARNINLPSSIVHAELLAIEEGLRISKEIGLKIDQVFFDSLMAVQVVTKPEEDFSYIGAVAASVKKLLDLNRNSRIMHNCGSANLVAHSLAHFSFSFLYPSLWVNGNFPFWLVNLVIQDLSYYE